MMGTAAAADVALVPFSATKHDKPSVADGGMVSLMITAWGGHAKLLPYAHIHSIEDPTQTYMASMTDQVKTTTELSA